MVCVKSLQSFSKNLYENELVFSYSTSPLQKTSPPTPLHDEKLNKLIRFKELVIEFELTTEQKKLIDSSIERA
jgi:hypothetical protein